jgi:hypothetical protein
MNSILNKKAPTYLQKLVCHYSFGFIKTPQQANFVLLGIVVILFVYAFFMQSNHESLSAEELQKYKFDPKNTPSEEEKYGKR